jgi:hypothetical protein
MSAALLDATLFKMAKMNLKFGIPDLELDLASGIRINPASLAGHQLIVLFCPVDTTAAAQEIAAYRRRSAELVDADAWLLTFADRPDDLPVDGAARAVTIPDRDRHAWVAFRDLADCSQEIDRSSGATFLFTRGGCLHRYWQGAGHVEEVLTELEHPRRVVR